MRASARIFSKRRYGLKPALRTWSKGFMRWVLPALSILIRVHQRSSAAQFSCSSWVEGNDFGRGLTRMNADQRELKVRVVASP